MLWKEDLRGLTSSVWRFLNLMRVLVGCAYSSWRTTVVGYIVSVPVLRPIIGFRVITKTERPRYEITFERATGGRPNEYHRVDIRVDRPNLNVLAPPGYYDWSVLPGGTPVYEQGPPAGL